MGRPHMPKDEDDLLYKEGDLLQHDEKGWKDGWAVAPPTVGRRMLSFPDDTQIGINGLDDILGDLYSEGRKANDETAEEIINRLEAKMNYIPSSGRARKEYSYVLLKEYKKYVKDRTDNNDW